MSRQEELAGLARKILVLHQLNECPEPPSETAIVHKNDLGGSNNKKRTLSLKQESLLAEAFALLAANSDDPARVAAACVEESITGESITVKLAVNKGALDIVQQALTRVASILQTLSSHGHAAFGSEYSKVLREIVQLHRNRVLGRLRSRHAKLNCNFKKDKKNRPSWIPSLCAAIDNHTADVKSGPTESIIQSQRALTKHLMSLFQKLEGLPTEAANSTPGLKIMIDMVKTCESLAAQISTHKSLPSLSDKATTIWKVGRYARISKLLVRYAQKFTIFRHIEIIPVKLQPSKCSVMQPTYTANETLKVARGQLSAARANDLESRDHGKEPAQTVVLKHPVHAEIQLLFHYELIKSKHPPRVICSNKKACFLCNLFFRLHGKFLIPSSHGRLYEKWALPIDMLSMDPSHHANILQTVRKFDKEISGSIIKELQLKRKPLAQPAESIIFQYKSESSAMTQQSEQWNKARLGDRNTSLSRTSTVNYQSSLGRMSSKSLAREDSHQPNLKHSKNARHPEDRAASHVDTDVDQLPDPMSAEKPDRYSDLEQTSLNDRHLQTGSSIVSTVIEATNTGQLLKERQLATSALETTTTSTMYSSTHGRQALKLQKGGHELSILSPTAETIDVFASKIHLELTLPQRICTHEFEDKFPAGTKRSQCSCWDFVRVHWLSTEEALKTPQGICIDIQSLSECVDYLEEMVQSSERYALYLRCRGEVICLELGRDQ